MHSIEGKSNHYKGKTLNAEFTALNEISKYGINWNSNYYKWRALKTKVITPSAQH